MIIVVVVLLLVDFYIWNRTRAFLIGDVKTELAKSMGYVKTQFDLESLQRKDLVKLKQFVDLVKSTTGFRTTVIDKQGRVLADSEIPVEGLARVENHLRRQEVQLALRTGSGIATRISATIHKKLIYYCETLKMNGRVVGFLRFALFRPEFNQKMSAVLGMILRLNLILFFTALVGVLIYVSWINYHIKKLRLHLLEQKKTEYRQGLPRQDFEELDRLASEVNIMAEKLNAVLQELKQEKLQLLNIFNTLGEGVAAFDARGLAIVFNRSFFRILQLEESRIQNQPYYDVLRFPPLIQDIENFLSSGQTVKTRSKYYRDTYIEYEILPLKSAEKQPGCFVLVVRDVTHLERLETIRTDFVANVTHEFKTPLTSIRGYAETLQSGLAKTPELQEKFLSKILNQTLRLENLVFDLLQLSRLEKEEVEELREIDPFPLVEEIGEEFRLIARSKKLNFFAEIQPPAKDVLVRANPDLVHALLSNLLGNAIQYNREKGTVWLRAGVREQVLRLEVQDTGIGIDREDQRRIFERFYRTDQAKTISAEGSGLGLSIIKHTVELLGGSYGVESTLGEGSTFWVEIPLVDKEDRI